MKAEIIDHKVERNGIDWNKPQFLICQKYGDLVIVMYMGSCDTVSKTFSAVVIIHPNHKTGYFTTYWNMDDFTRLTSEVTIKISND